MTTYPTGVHTVGPGQWPYDDGTLLPFGPDGQQRLAARISQLAGAGIGYAPDVATRDALVANGDAFVGLHVYVAAVDQVHKWTGSVWAVFGLGNAIFEMDSAATVNIPKTAVATTILSQAINLDFTQPLEIGFTALAQVGAANTNVAGHLIIKLNGFQIGNTLRIGNLNATGNSPVPIVRTVRGRGSAGVNTILVQADVDTASSSTFFINNPQLEVFQG